MTKFEELSQEKLMALYFDYIEYRDALSYLDQPIGIKKFYYDNGDDYE